MGEETWTRGGSFCLLVLGCVYVCVFEIGKIEDWANRAANSKNMTKNGMNLKIKPEITADGRGWN